jgi:ATP-dependent 26S proteasome regulatory subunit
MMSAEAEAEAEDDTEAETEAEAEADTEADTEAEAEKEKEAEKEAEKEKEETESAAPEMRSPLSQQSEVVARVSSESTVVVPTSSVPVPVIAAEGTLDYRPHMGPDSLVPSTVNDEDVVGVEEPPPLTVAETMISSTESQLDTHDASTWAIWTPDRWIARCMVLLMVAVALLYFAGIIPPLWWAWFRRLFLFR